MVVSENCLGEAVTKIYRNLRAVALGIHKLG